jgi:serralysin
MATINGTSGADIYTVKSGDLYNGMAGDDIITIEKGGTAQGNEGNDTITALPDLNLWDATVWYWWSPKAIYIDLEAGYALDGYGYRDTLVNIHHIDGLNKDGDQVYGTSSSDTFWADGNYHSAPGTVIFDGRGGFDYVTIRETANDVNKLGDLILNASADGRSVIAYYQKTPNFTYQIRNIEQITVWTGDKQIKSLSPQSLIDLSAAGKDILLRGDLGWQSASPGTATTISYSFPQAAPATGGEGGKGFTAFSPAMMQTVRGIFAQLSLQTGLTFLEIGNDTGGIGQGAIRFAINDQSDTRGYSYIPDAYKNDSKAGDVWLDVQTTQLMQPGQEGYYVLLHEIGHALGLQHPLPPSDTSGATVLLDAFNTMANTIMADQLNGGPNWPVWYGNFDMQALRYLYGTKAFASNDTTYSIIDGAPSASVSILDDGGIDTLDVSKTSVSASIDLRAGKMSSAGLSADGIAYLNNISIASGTIIENVVATVSDDVLIGNDASNRFVLNGGNDMVDGGGGIDTAVFNFARGSVKISPALTLGTWNVESTTQGGSCQLTNVERFQFGNAVLATDLGIGDSAGRAVLLIGAVLGKDAMMSKPALMGSVISLFDMGYDMGTLAGAVMRLPIWAGVLTPTNSADDIANYLFKVVNGRAPSAAELASGLNSLNTQSQGSYLAQLAVSDANTKQVNLVGLAASGFDYLVA